MITIASCPAYHWALQVSTFQLILHLKSHVSAKNGIFIPWFETFISFTIVTIIIREENTFT